MLLLLLLLSWWFFRSSLTGEVREAVVEADDEEMEREEADRGEVLRLLEWLPIGETVETGCCLARLVRLLR